VKKLEEGKKVIVGVNAYTMDEHVQPEILQIDPALQEKQIGRLRAHREKRNARDCGTSLDGVRQCASEDRNLMPSLLKAVQAGATVGEISAVLRGVWGEYEGT